MAALSRRQFTNNASSTLASTLASGAVSLQVASGEGALFPQPSDLTDGHFFVTLEDSGGVIEIVKCTARSSDTLTVVRAQEGTSSPASFAATTTRVEVRMTANLLTEWLLPSFVRYLAAGHGLTFEGPGYPSTATDIATILGIEDPNRAGKLLLDISGGPDADVRVHADSRKVIIQDLEFPDGTGTAGQILVLSDTDTLVLGDVEVQLVNSADANMTKRPNIKFGDGFTLTDNSGADQTEVTYDTGEVGVVYDWAGSSAPTWGLFCFGQTLDSVANTEYASLFTVIGTTYGGTGANDFVVPDLRGRTVAGKDNMGGVAASRLTSGSAAGLDGTTLGTAGGSEEHTLTEAELASHAHQYTQLQGAANRASGSGFGLSGSVNADTGDAGSDNAHTNVQPTIVLNKVIRFKP